MATYEWEGRWVCTTGGSNKFYEIHQTRNGQFHCVWGAIGTSGSSIIYNYDKVMKKVRGFRAKGYRKVGSGVRPTEAVIKATPLFEPEVRGRLSAVDDDEKQIEKVKKVAKVEKTEKKQVHSRLSDID